MIKVERKQPIPWYMNLVYFLLFLSVFVLPLATQISEFSMTFQSVCSNFNTPGELAYGSVIACAIVGLLGALTFSGWRALAWCSLMVIFSLAIIRAETTRHMWSIWQSRWDYSLFQSYFLQVAMLGLIPIQVWLWKHKQPVIEWIKLSLGFVAGLQGVITVFQFLMLRNGYQDTLNELGLSSATLYTPRDSTRIYTEASRLTGLTTSPTLLGMILMLSWPALLFGKFGTWPKSLKLLASIIRALLIILTIWAVVLTYTRASYIGLALQCLALGFIACYGRPNMRKPAAIYFVIVLISVITALFVIPSSGARVTAIADGADASITNRLAVYKVAGALLAERPLTGWGPGFFNILYNRFYKLPYVSYDFFDGHSAVVNTFMEIGVAGIFLGAVAFLGFRWKYLSRVFPPWIWIGMIGAALPIFTDNPSSSPAFMYPAIWVMGATIICSIAGEQLASRAPVRRKETAAKQTQRISYFIISGTFIVALLSYFIPIKSPETRLINSLKPHWPASTQQLGIYISDKVTGRVWAINGDEPMDGASISKLAIAAALIYKSANDDSIGSKTLSLQNAWGEGSGIWHVLPLPPADIATGNALHLMLSLSDNTCANALLDYVGAETLSLVLKQAHKLTTS